MRMRIFLRAGAFLAAMSLIATSAAAQTTGDVSFGCSFMSIDEGGAENIPLGWNVSFAGGGTGRVSAVGDIGGHYNQGWRQHTFQGGVRFSFRNNPKVVPFVQILTGVAAGRTGQTYYEWTLQPGAGVDIFVRERVPGFRVQVDFPAHLGIEGFFTTRLTVGVVIPIK
jgi:hypothetical protein